MKKTILFRSTAPARRLSSVLALLIVLSPLTIVMAQLQVKNIASLDNPKMFKATAKNFGSALKKSEIPKGTTDKGILSCNALGGCSVRNMPLLLQTDALIPSSLSHYAAVGCYDTSTVSVIIAALANRSSSSPAPAGRTKQFMSISAVQLPGTTIPKEVRQLTWQYGNAKQQDDGAKNFKGKVIQRFYFHEVLADFGKVNEDCDPYTYGSCMSTTNSSGHAFWEVVGYSPWNDATWTNEQIIKKMQAGYAMMIAYGRFDPLISQDKRTGKPVVDFKKSSQHKVVFIGFQPGKYPLLINDVGNGQQYRVRLSTDLSPRGFNKIGPHRYPTETKIFLEYEGAPLGAKDQVFFVEHVNGFRLK